VTSTPDSGGPDSRGPDSGNKRGDRSRADHAYENNTDASDQDLLRAHVAGDSEAFGLLFARHRDRLWAVALRTMGDPHDAADGLQDGLIAAYRRAATYRGDAAVTTWLHRVVVNACLDRLRAAKVRRAEPLPDMLEEYADRGALASSRSTNSTDPVDTVIAGERHSAVVDALATLPAEQRAALVLVDMEGYPITEVAAILGVAEGTVKSRCSRGRAKLAGLLGVLHDEHADSPTPLGNLGPASPVRSDESPRGPPRA
jgi:RNA polymerase sigma-70 factor, ECF subfamily